ncbi:nuclear transport factor 2 family protein [Conexibacter woesei]|uniref:SnoaL-like domain-containing protein n=1 Tax=Conexibacter woesei (strain DSM 14684 / CCUG 47730 / CIP 108061 / JCM 11494 / NBRC 100937 / ID131577) TaxID=469383 RepID=D3F909_CONWI|nr:nuclear transport factor 2 family protein [Conexibacter woesei]ADB53004.1 hypothetical protein Cwoe_4591 [Conexibacter woesei DSM 14684]
MTAQTTDRRVQELTDRSEIADLVARLGAWLDRQRPDDDPRTIFDAGVAVSTPGGTAEGIDAVIAQATRNHAAHRTQHAISDLLIDLDEAGERATVGANLIVTFASEPLVQLGERYRFETVRGAAGWRLARVEVMPIWRS